MAGHESTLTRHEVKVLNLYREHRHPVEVSRRYIPGKKVPCEGHYVYSVDGLEPVGEQAYRLLKSHLLKEHF